MLNDEQARESTLRRLQEVVDNTSPYGPSYYSQEQQQRAAAAILAIHNDPERWAFAVEGFGPAETYLAARARGDEWATAPVTADERNRLPGASDDDIMANRQTQKWLHETMNPGVPYTGGKAVYRGDGWPKAA
jgi:hypothetical protein